MKRSAPIRVALALPIAAAVTLLSSCGGDQAGSTSGGPSTLVPADTPLYVEAVLRPEGDQREDLDSALAALLGSDDPGARIVELLDRQLAEDDAGIAWAEDIEPWLGERAGLFVQPPERGRGEVEAAALVETSDADAALAAVEKSMQASGESTRSVSYGGVTYLRTKDGDVSGVVDDHLVAGTEGAMRAVIDASDGDSLADSDRLGEFEPLRADSIVAIYADPAGFLDALVASGKLAESDRDAAAAQLGIGTDEPVVGALDATGESFSAQFSAAAGAVSVASDPALLEGLPADSWLAFGASDFGSVLERATDGIDAQIAANPATPPELERGLDAATERALGLELRDEILSWIGDVSFYVRGTSIFGLNLAAIVETKDEARSAATLDAVRSELERTAELSVEPLEGDQEGFEVTIPGVPVQIPVVQAAGKVIAGLGEDSIATALDPGETLGDSEAFDAASGALGDDFAGIFFVDFEPLVGLIESTGQTTSDPDYEHAKPYLDALDYFVAGTQADDDRATVRAVLGVGSSE